MGSPTDAPQVSDNTATVQTAEAQHLSTTSQFAGKIAIADSNLSNYNVDRQQLKDGSITQYPNGVRYNYSNGEARVDAPPGGTVEKDSNGGMNIYDSHHKLVAEMDAMYAMHVHTKNGEYVETKDGKVSFTPKGAAHDLSKLHNPGTIPHSKMEDYGLSSDGKTTRFPNGVEYNPKTGKVDHNPDRNICEKTSQDAHGKPVTTGFDENGKVMYTLDDKGIHVPTADGVLNESKGGGLSFERKSAADKALPNLELTCSNPAPATTSAELVKKHSRRVSTDALGSKCMESNDPLCGLDLDDNL